MVDHRFFYILIVVILFFGIAAPSPRAKEYLWPTDASRLLTSTFGEYRPNRLHAGIDVKTWGKEGQPVFALRAGYVAQIEVSPFGYGRALYLKMDSGEMALYAHLQKFAPAIEAYVRQQQQQLGRFSVVLYPEEERFPVRQGEVVAFTGRSGIGLPHLHLEILDEEGRPTNPLLKQFELNDTIAPTIKSLALLPLSARSRVRGDLRPLLLRPKVLTPNRFIIDQPIAVKGLIGFAVEVHDHMDDTWNSFGIYRLTLKLNDKTIFASHYDYFDYEQNRQANLDRDYRLLKRGHGLYNRLFRDIGNELPFYDGTLPYYGVVAFADEPQETDFFTGIWRLFGWENSRPAGVIDLSAGEYDLHITAEDFFGNASTLSGRLLVKTAIAGEHFAAKNVPKMTASSPLSVEYYDEFIRFEVMTADQNIKPALAVEYENGSSEQLVVDALGNGRYIAGFPLQEWRAKITAVTALYETAAGKMKLLRQPLVYETVPLDRAKTIVSQDGRCRIAFDKGSLFKPIFIRMNRVPTGDIVGGEMMSECYEIQPADVPLRRHARVAIHIDRDHPQHIGLFRRKHKNGWEFLGDSLNVDDHTITALTNELGTFALIWDQVPPAISSLQPAMGAKLQDRKPLLRAKIWDELSDIGQEEDWGLYLDGRRVIAEYDPEAQTLFYRCEEPLTRGEHQVRVWVRDRCQNTAEQSHTFYID